MVKTRVESTITNLRMVKTSIAAQTTKLPEILSPKRSMDRKYILFLQ